MESKISLKNFSEDIKKLYNADINVIEPQHIDENKYNCVFGVYLSEEGIKIKDEMLSYLPNEFNLWVVEQQTENQIGEYPALKYMELLIKSSEKSCAYIHTKGAFFKNKWQKIVRQLWKDEIIKFKNWYFDDENEYKIVKSPFVGEFNETYFNFFVVNKNVFEDLTIEFNEDRYKYEKLFKDYDDIIVKGRIIDKIKSSNINDIFLYLEDNYPIKICVCSTYKTSDLNIKEYIEHYKKQGIDKIFLYDYSGVLHDMIPEYVNNKFVEIIDYQEYEKSQTDAYQDCYDKYKNEYDWFLFFDVNEYLNHAIYSIRTYLFLNYFYKMDFNGILVNLCCYSGNQPLSKDYFDGTHFVNTKVKTILRGGLDNVIWNSEEACDDASLNSHVPMGSKNLKFCSPSGTPLEMSPFQYINWHNLSLIHYIS